MEARTHDRVAMSLFSLSPSALRGLHIQVYGDAAQAEALDPTGLDAFRRELIAQLQAAGRPLLRLRDWPQHRRQRRACVRLFGPINWR